MIGYIKGRVVCSKNLHTIICLDSGLGYEIKTRQNYPEGKEVALFIYHSISENDQTLWGFEKYQERDLFELLLSVNKVGPSKAYPLVMTLGIQNLINGILYEDAGILSKSPGIGKKMAEQIILSLKDKIKDFALENNQVSLKPMDDLFQSEVDAAMSSEVVDETVQALVSLGYKDKEVIPLINKHFDGSHTSEGLIKLVLKEL